MRGRSRKRLRRICLIRASDAAAEALQDVSDDVFTINPPTADDHADLPYGRRGVDFGTTQAITWGSSGVTGNVNIYLYKGAVNAGLIASKVPSSAAFTAGRRDI